MIKSILKKILKAGERSLQARARKREMRKKQPYDVNNLNALAQFILAQRKVSTFTEETARQNVYAGLVEIMVHGIHSSNGLLVTRNGYFITSYHCVDDAHDMPLRVRLQNGERYPIERVCIRERKIDIALAKIALPGPAEPHNYSFYTGLYEVDTQVKSLARWYGKCMRRHGKLINPWVQGLAGSEGGSAKPFHRHFRMNLYAQNGDSGSTLITNRGEVAGIMVPAAQDRRTTTAARWCDALDVVRQYIDYQNKKSGYAPIP